MDEVKRLKETIKKAAEAVCEYKQSRESLDINLGKLGEALGGLTEELEAITLQEGTQTLDNSQITEVTRLLEIHFSFKPTAMIADFLRRKSPEFEDMNNFQIGILLSKCGFKSGHNSKARGYYVKYTEL